MTAADLPMPELDGEDELGLATRAEVDEIVQRLLALDEAAQSDEAAYDDADQLEHQVRERWLIEDWGAAEWAMGRLVEARRQQAELTAQAAEWRRPLLERLERIDAWLERAARGPGRTAALFEGMLADYQRRLRAANPKAKTLELPSGQVRSTDYQPKVAVGDDAALIAWARENLEPDEVGEVVKVTESVKVSGLRDVASVAKVPVLEVWTLELTCDHSKVVQRDVGASEPAAPRVGESIVCEQCDVLRGVAALSMELQHRLEVQDGAGRPVPGAVVEPGHLEIKVVPS